MSRLAAPRAPLSVKLSPPAPQPLRSPLAKAPARERRADLAGRARSALALGTQASGILLPRPKLFSLAAQGGPLCQVRRSTYDATATLRFHQICINFSIFRPRKGPLPCDFPAIS